MGEWYFSKNFQSGSKIGKDERIGIAFYLTHDCPFCGKRGSEYRALTWIVDSCISSGKAEFPCDDCREYITFPSEVFKEGLFKSLMRTRLDGVEYWSDSELFGKTPNEIFVKDWLQVLFMANKGGPVDLDHIEWDGKGACPGCGKANPEILSQSLECPSCSKYFSINQKDINRDVETYVLCHNCNFKMIIPPTVWCSKCKQNLQPSNMFIKLFESSNKKNTEKEFADKKPTILEKSSENRTEQNSKKWWQFWK